SWAMAAEAAQCVRSIPSTSGAHIVLILTPRTIGLHRACGSPQLAIRIHATRNVAKFDYCRRMNLQGVLLTKRKVLMVGISFAGTVALALFLFGNVVQAQDWPARPVTMVVPYAAGGPVDTIGRIMAAALSEK